MPNKVWKHQRIKAFVNKLRKIALDSSPIRDPFVIVQISVSIVDFGEQNSPGATFQAQDSGPKTKSQL